MRRDRTEMKGLRMKQQANKDGFIHATAKAWEHGCMDEDQ
jgi:hypothetical protein